MIHEHARITIRPGTAAAFEDAFRTTGRAALAAAPGCRSVALRRSAEGPDVYLLVVGWDTVDDHLVTFPTTPQAAALGAAIAGYFDGDPAVEHFEGEDVG
ncbi:MAG: antibiotic biosynthesis monooxygenase [Solirubrobacteraceae bacterium]